MCARIRQLDRARWNHHLYVIRRLVIRQRTWRRSVGAYWANARFQLRHGFLQAIVLLQDNRAEGSGRRLLRPSTSAAFGILIDAIVHLTVHLTLMPDWCHSTMDLRATNLWIATYGARLSLYEKVEHWGHYEGTCHFSSTPFAATCNKFEFDGQRS